MAIAHEHQHASTLTWGLFLVLALIAVFIAAGFSFAPLALVGVIVAFLLAFRYTYLSLYAGIALTPFLGFTLSIPTGNLLFGERAFGGSIDISVGEAVLFVVLAAWAVKLFIFWYRRKDEQWRPRLPLIHSYAALVLAHLASAFSPLLPDPLVVAKFAFRPVLYCYLAFIALPVNLLKSRKRLVTALAIVAGVGTFAAATGFVSIFTSGGSLGFPVSPAHPITLFGVSALGVNHNELAELLVFTALASLALAELVREERTRAVLRVAAVFQFGIGLFTFTRTAWIVYALEAAALFATIWREDAKRHARSLAIAALFLLPLATAMVAYSFSETAASSSSTRLMLSEIAWNLFQSSPWLGAGAGSFLDRVGSTRIFLQEYGAPLDSHGILQKIGAETGVLGLLALGAVALHFAALARRGFCSISSVSAQRAFVLLAAGAAGAMCYQIFNTAYWTGDMWLPIGLALAAANVLKEAPRDTISA